MRTDTRTTDGALLLSTEDEMLLLHGVAQRFYTEQNALCRNDDHAITQAVRRVYFRWEWDPNLWRNNIHTDAYAQRFGFKRGLPEFVVYMDWAFALLYAQIGGERAWNDTRITFDRILPMYEKDEVQTTLGPFNEGGASQLRFLRNGEERLRGSVRVPF